MCCIFTILVFLGPRTGILVWWLVNSARWEATFNTFLVPFLGFLFFPWTTLMYVGVGFNGLQAFDWVWMGIAVLADLGMYVGGGYGNRERLGYGSR